MKIQHLALLLACLLANYMAGAEKSAGGKRNILFVAVDGLRPELGCYGQANIISPNIDALAKSGLLFKHAYISQVLCWPSGTAIMTGVHPDTSKIYDLTTHFRKTMPDVITLGQSFKNNAYFDKAIGKIYHGKLDDPPTWSTPWKQISAPMYTEGTNKTENKGEEKPKKEVEIKSMHAC